MSLPAHFVPARDPWTFYPLSSYLRVPSASVAEEYIRARSAPGDLIVDPFACTPTIARAAARLGRRSLAVESNPLWSWLAHTMANLPPLESINAALTHLGDTLKDGVPLRTHINQMYATVCSACLELTPADWFLFQRQAGPVHRHYTCAHCGKTRDEAATEDDLRRAASFEAHGFHYHFAFERIAPPEHLHAQRIQKMLDLYTPRHLQALVTITVKMDTLFYNAPEHDLLLLLFLHILDRGTSFYTDPAPTSPARLEAHKQFIEFNLWRELEEAAQALGRQAGAPIDRMVNATSDVLEGEAARVFVGRGSARALACAIPAESAAMVLTAPPVRRMGVWALAYFWGAWILGRGAVESLISALDPHAGEPQWERRWYLEVLTGAFEGIGQLLKNDASAVFIFDESWHEVIESLLLAAANARFQMESFLFQPSLGDFPRREFDSITGSYRIVLGRRPVTPLQILAEVQLSEKIRTSALGACREILTRRGQPLAYSWVHHAAYVRAFREGLLSQVMSASPKVPPARFVFYAVREGLGEGYAHDLDHWATANMCLWFRRGPPSVPLFDRVDDAVKKLLGERQTLAPEELQNLIYVQFPGDLTPERGLLELCARAYADQVDSQWLSRTEDLQKEKADAMRILTTLGERLEYRIGARPPFDLTWEVDGEVAHGFAWRERARWDDLIQTPIAPTKGYLLVPETQAELLGARVHMLPLRAQAVRNIGWDYVRIPFAERLLEESQLERRDITLITGLVPPVAGERTQLELF